MKHSDRPIFRPKEDLLGRAKFSLSLARAIDNLTVAKDGFVIAVMGEWGSGKSSAVEMTTRFLTHLEMERASKAPEKQTLDSLEPLAEAFDKVRDKVAELDLSNLDLSMAHYVYRRNLFRSWLGDQEEADRADRYWILLQAIQKQRHTLQIRFSPWLIAGRAELASAFLSELARSLVPRHSDYDSLDATG
jgi:hypothetical protein